MNRSFRAFYVGALIVIGIGLFGSSFVPRLHADNWNKMTIVTVNEPIIAGNKVLEPGTYVWKLMDSQSDRHIVQIFDKDQKHLEETILAIPNERLRPTGNTQFTFWETPSGVPKAVRAWFYPGDNFGQEFAYPKKLVAQLASAAPVPIPMNYHEPEPAPEPVAQPSPSLEPAAAPASESAAAEPTLAAPQPEAEAAPPVPQRPASLPHTASFDPTVGFAGLISLGLAGLLALVTRRRID